MKVHLCDATNFVHFIYAAKSTQCLEPARRRSRLETWLEVELQACFSGRILSIDAPVADPPQLDCFSKRRRLYERRSASGKSMGTMSAEDI